MTVFDGHSHKPIAQSDLLVDGHECYQFASNDPFSVLGTNACSPAVRLPMTYVVDRWDQYRPDQREFIRNAIVPMLGPSVDYTLRRLKLVS